MIINWKKEILTVPNLLSFFRLALIPVYVILYLNATTPKEYFLSGAILAVSCLTDMVDGQIARRFNMISNVGKLLDPLADKATQFTLTLCLSLKYPVLHPVLALFLVKEIFQLIAFLIHFRRGKALPGSIFAGKMSTVVLFVSLIIMVLFPNMNSGLVTAISIIDTLFLGIAFVSYIFAFFGKHTKVQDMKTE